jgi:hypothetical protein
MNMAWVNFMSPNTLNAIALHIAGNLSIDLTQRFNPDQN